MQTQNNLHLVAGDIAGVTGLVTKGLAATSVLVGLVLCFFGLQTITQRSATFTIRAAAKKMLTTHKAKS